MDARLMGAMAGVWYNSPAMMSDDPHHDGSDDRPRRAGRRPRYAGTHPRRFNERYKELNPAAFPEIQEHVRAQGRTPAGTHVPVLLAEVLELLRPRPGELVVDCTLGYGGHALELLSRVEPGGRLIGLDHDARQLARAAERLGGVPHQEVQPGLPVTPLGSPRGDSPPSDGPPRVSLHRSHFGGVGKVLAKERVEACDIILADLGPSSMQLDDPARGFSYKYDGPLDMRMDDRLATTAADLLATLSVDELSAMLLDLADEPDHERIAREIVRRRSVEPIQRTRQLVRLIAAVKEGGGKKGGGGVARDGVSAGVKELNPAGGKKRRQAEGQEQRSPAAGKERHPAARTFQALRMLVNDEVGGLEQFLRVAPYCLRAGGRLGIITFHSGEHRRVEEALREGRQTGLFAKITEAPIKPTPQEVNSNPRSRSARLYGAVRNGL